MALSGWNGNECSVLMDNIDALITWVEGNADVELAHFKQAMIHLVSALRAMQRVDQPSGPEYTQVCEQFRLDVEQFAHIMEEHYGEGSSVYHYRPHLYDHLLTCHAHSQMIRTGGIGALGDQVFEAAHQKSRLTLNDHMPFSAGDQQIVAQHMIARSFSTKKGKGQTPEKSKRGNYHNYSCDC